MECTLTPGTIDSEFLKNHSLFGGLSVEALESVKILLESEEFPDGLEIISEGKPNSKIFFIMTGTVRVLKKGREVAVFSEGETFGEMEFLDVMPAAATVRAVGTVRAATYTRTALHHIYKMNPDAFSFMMMNLARDLSRRLRAMDERLGTETDLPLEDVTTERLLESVDDAEACATLIAGRLRSFSGAKAVLTFLKDGPQFQSRLLSVTPPEWNTPGRPEWALHALTDFAENLERASPITARVDLPSSEKAVDALKELDTGITIAAPLVSRRERLGAILVIGVREGTGITETLDGVDRFALMLGSLLGNAARIKRLTASLSEKEHELEKRNSELAKAIGDRETGIKEIHHRVRNNLQVINSLLSLQSAKSPDLGVREALLQSRNRLLSMALAHEEMYISKNISLVPMADYLPRLTENIIMNQKATIAGIYRIGNVQLPVTEAIPVGLVVGELLMNCCRHAFVPGQRGTVTVSMESTNDICTLRVSDDGIGLPEKIIAGQRSSLGLQIVDSLVLQLDGSLDLGNSEGAWLEISFKASVTDFPD